MGLSSVARCAGLLCLLAPLNGQGLLDVLDGETLYDGGFLTTLGFEFEAGDILRTGSRRVADPQALRERTRRTTFALQYGLRHDLQIGFSLPYVDRERVGVGIEQRAGGLGDLDLLLKWRCYRWDAPGAALNVAVLAEMSLPTGDDARRSAGMRLEPELQPGSGSFDPAAGLAATYEPGRWRYNLAARHRWRTDFDDDGAHLGDDTVAEAAIGNRFWLEPYPGPFMRADLVLRYYREGRAALNGPLANSGTQRSTIAVNWAFRPRPALDLQLHVELPLWQEVTGTQIGDDWSAGFTFGFRF